MTHWLLIDTCTCEQMHTHTHALTQTAHCHPQVSERTGHQSNKPEVAVLRAWIYFPQEHALTAG